MKHTPNCKGGHWPSSHDCTGEHDPDCIGLHVGQRCRTKHSPCCTGRHRNDKCVHADSCRYSICKPRHTHSRSMTRRWWLLILPVAVAVVVILIFIPPILWPIKQWLGCTWPADYVDHMGGSWDDLKRDVWLQCWQIVKP